METNDSKEVFNFSYSAKQQEEVKNIRDKYLPKPEDKMEELRRLDASVTQKGTLWSLVLGIISALILGLGMSMCMVWGGGLFIPGIIIGVIGLAGVAFAYPLYEKITRAEREKIAPEIIRLTDELMK